jgi:excisionase family DNA binding protein
MADSITLTGTRLLTVPELADLLSVSSTSVYRLVEHRMIPFYRLPRGLRFKMSDVTEFLSSRRVETVDGNYGRPKDRKHLVG